MGYDMRQVIIITAYKNEEQIYDIIKFFGGDFEFYIHIDKKSATHIRESRNVHVYKKYTVNWGSVNHLKTILFLSDEALKDVENGYFHLITGQDFPIKSKDYFCNELDTKKDYLEFSQLPSESWVDGGMSRIEYYNFHDLFDYKKKIGRLFIRGIVKIQKILKTKRRKTLKNFFQNLYGGSTYWSLTRSSLQHVIDSTNEKILSSMRFTFCVEEIYFQTVLLNSMFSNNITNDNLRYIDWVSGRGGYPAFLDETDYNIIKSSNKIFARKFHEKNSLELKALLLNNG